MDWKDILAGKLNSGAFPEADTEPATTDENCNSSDAENDIIEVCIDRKGRKGKSATIAAGFTCSDSDLKALASKLKTALSTGGSARGGEILIQGDRVNDVKKLLREFGYKVK
ncbi:MAG: translation initiation factor [Bacteroides sp.]|nr:translation initiation factor [Bacteroides sp.]